MTGAAGEGADFEDGLTEAWGEPDGIAETAAPGEAAVAPGEAVAAPGEGAAALGEAAGAALRTSPSSRPTRRAALCLAVSRVNNKVTAKKMHPR
ncbi:MAG TPA: hypothetical protein VF207_00115 [Chthoniobacterales bacterium]